MKCIALLLLLLVPAAARAHGIGEVYTLPIPLHYYVINTALVVALSFIILGLFFNKKSQKKSVAEKIIKLRALPFIMAVAKYVTFTLFTVAIVAGIVNQTYLYAHFTPVFFWVYFIIGASLLSAVVGNSWEKINPFKTFAELLRVGATAQKTTPVWVAPLLLFVFIWFELVSASSFAPQTISAVLLAYCAVTLVGANTYRDWFRHGDVFGAMFGTFGIVSHLKLNPDNTELHVAKKEEQLRDVPHAYLLALSWLLLSGATFDSIKETVHWFNLFEKTGLHMDYQNLQVFNTTGLILTPLFFVVTYLLSMRLMKWITRTNISTLSLAHHFTYSLIPIAFGYILAHNFSLFIVSGPQMFSLISDPFNFGWNLFGTADFMQTELILGAKFVWFIEAGFILLAHIVGVIYAHIIALSLFQNGKVALKSQYPLVVLMVFYTALTLWLISQPLVINQ